MVIRRLINARGKGHTYTIEMFITDDKFVRSYSKKTINKSDTKLRMKKSEDERLERLACGDNWIPIDAETFVKEIIKPRYRA
jgi:methionine aminopeptidase